MSKVIMLHRVCDLKALLRCRCVVTQLIHSSSTIHTYPDEEMLPELDDDFKKTIFNTKLWEADPTVSYMGRRALLIQQKKKMLREARSPDITPTRSLCVNLLQDTKDFKTEEQTEVTNTEEEVVSYPYDSNKSLNGISNEGKQSTGRGRQRQVIKESELRAQALRSWMSNFEHYNEKENLEADMSVVMSNRINYGTADKEMPVSRIPCGGCGALLHCQNPSIPGYLPKELVCNRSKNELRSLICQRCHFLKEFNVSLDVNVTPDEYPKILSQIKEKRGIVVLLVDLLDFPCSLWPGIMDIIGEKRPVVIVGNKIDLIPGDQQGYLQHITKCLQTSIENMGIGKANIKFTCLISAQTGFGVEDLITRLHTLWEYKSDVYLVGCTNVGKSTLFNTLIQSDFCKSQAVDLVRRATTSVWPGTTLNLLKFPILRPEGYVVTMRRERLKAEEKKLAMEKKLRKEQLKRRRLYHMPSFLQYVGRTFIRNRELIPESEMHVIPTGKPSVGEGKTKIGLNDADPAFAKGRWCFDTPGVLHPDQILDLLTVEEIGKVLPSTTLVPRFFTLKPGKSLFLGGLGRLDFLSSENDFSARFTVFASKDLPITVSNTVEADFVYSKLVGSVLMAVPCGGPKRLAAWPGLKPKDEALKCTGAHYLMNCADIVLSSAGWISISGGKEAEMCFKAWTPHARGIYIRHPSLLPFSVNFRGQRIDHTPTYRNQRADGKLFTGKHVSGRDLLPQ